MLSRLNETINEKKIRMLKRLNKIINDKKHKIWNSALLIKEYINISYF